MSAASTQLTPFDHASAAIVGLRPDFEKLLGGSASVERFERAVLTAIAGNRDLLNVPPDTLLDACRKAAADRLLPDGKEGAVVCRYNSRTKREEATWQPMVHGVVKIAKLYGGLKSLSVELVYKGEPFSILLGDEMRIEHKRIPECVSGVKENVIGCYAILVYGPQPHEREREFMSFDQIEAIRMRSPAGKLGKGPWGTDWGEMAKKTVIHRAAKRIADRDETSELMRQVVGRIEDEYDYTQRDEPHRAPPEAPEARSPRQQAERGAAGPAAAFRAAAGGKVRDVDPGTGEVEGAPPPPPADPDLTVAAKQPDAPVLAFISHTGNVVRERDPADWRRNWMEHIRIAERTDLEADWRRNGAMFAETAKQHPELVAEVVGAIRAALLLSDEPVSELDTTPDPAFVPLKALPDGKPDWRAWAEWMRAKLADCKTAADCKHLQTVNGAALHTLSQAFPKSYGAFIDRVVQRTAEIAAEANPPQPAGSDVHFGA